VWSHGITDKIVVAQRLLRRLQAAGAALRNDPGDLVPDAGWDIADAALLARSLAELTAHLPEGVATLKPRSPTPAHPSRSTATSMPCGPLEKIWWPTPTAWHTASTRTYGPHGRHPHR
jgi:hypothetical protein